MENKARGKQGNALIYVVMVFAVIAILAMGAVYLASSNTNMTKMEVFQQQAYYTAKSNLDEFIASVSKPDQQPSYVELMQKLLTNKQSTSTIDVGETAGTATINLTCQEDDGSYCIKAKIESIGTYKGYSQSVSGLLKLTYSGSGEMFFANAKDSHIYNEYNLVYYDNQPPTIISNDDLPIYKQDFLSPPDALPWQPYIWKKRNELLMDVLKDIINDEGQRKDIDKLPSCNINNAITKSCKENNMWKNPDFLIDTSKNDIVINIVGDASINFIGTIKFTENSIHKAWFYTTSGSLNISPLHVETNIHPLPNGDTGVVFIMLSSDTADAYLGKTLDKSKNYMYFIAPNSSTTVNIDLYGGIISNLINNGQQNVTDIYLREFSDNIYLERIYDIVIGGDVGTGGGNVPQVEASYE